MCTAISYYGKHHYFGRNLDLEYAYAEQVVITPRNFPFHFRSGNSMPAHYAMIGIATVANGTPLYYEATNECGVSMAALNFPHSAVYLPKIAGRDNLAPYELIPWILGQCGSVDQAADKLRGVNVWALPFSRELPLSPLHWILADKKHCIVAEPCADGLKLYENPVGVLTNEPNFPYHMQRLHDFMGLHPGQAENHFQKITLKPYSNGMGALGLPGDFSSVSRFVKAAFVKDHSQCHTDEVAHFFRMLNSVAMPEGSVRIDDACEITRYSCCCDTEKGIYYYTTYENSRLRAVRLRHINLDDDQLHAYELLRQPDIFWQN